ncbi:MAG: sigma-70 family RNA polymerase sigma factor [Lachnospiraceae bacterium]|nr:sigma-70 family RNA polymerase sigma factor [Lachnospiraceae bacterium]
MQTNEQLCRLAQTGDPSALNTLIENNWGFIRKTAIEIYQNHNLDESDMDIEVDDLMQEGSLGLLKAVPLFDGERGMKFLTYAAPAIRNSMADLIRKARQQFEQQITDPESEIYFQRVYLDDVLNGEERLLRIEAIADPYAKLPEQIVVSREELQELYSALEKLSAREQTYILYRYGFTDDIEHTLIGTAIHFHLSASRAKRTEETALEHLRGKFSP